MTGMIEKLKVLPETARLSITFDRGTEFAYYPLLKQKLGMAATSASRKHPGRRVRLRTPMAGSGASCRVTQTSQNSPMRR
jgi:hypothetical protein